MIYTEKMKKEINSAGFQVIEIKYFIKAFMKKVNAFLDAMVETMRKMVEQIRNAYGDLLDVIDTMQELPPRQRYKFCRKLGIENYQCFFRRKQAHRARSCC